MLKRICLALVAASLAFPAYAAECHAFDKSRMPAGTKFTTLTSGQTHFAQGAFTAVPPIGPPPGDGAMLIEMAQDKGAAIAFTSNKGKLVCQIMVVVPSFVRALLKVGTGHLEDVIPSAPPASSHDDELKI